MSLGLNDIPKDILKYLVISSTIDDTYHQGYLQMSLQILKYRGSLENMFRSVETYILRISSEDILKHL